jgi:hypothetical protein
MEFASEDLKPVAPGADLICPVCGKKIQSSNVSSVRVKSNFPFLKLIIVVIIVAVAAALYYNHDRQKEAPARPIIIGDKPTTSDITVQNRQAVEQTNPISQLFSHPDSDKKQIVKKIAADFHRNHTYTLEGDFVCLDMAIDVWNQLMTKGIEAKIMGGNVREDVTAWNYRQLLKESNHAWVIAKLSPTEKVAVETTAGVILEPNMPKATAYFKGIEFNNPAEVKKFDSLRNKAKNMCKEAKTMVDDWNSYYAGKQKQSPDTIARKAQIDQRVRDCENAWNGLEEFRSRAIFY